jgi:hypothetical protein
MTNGTNGRRGFWVGFALLLLVGVFLGIRVGGAVHAVLGGRVLVSGGPADTAGIAALPDGAKDTLIADALMGDRDPFRDPPAVRIEGGGVAKASPAIAKEPPALRALLYDNVNPSVQLSQDATISGWLHKGDSFLGWTVIEITSTSTTISRGGESVVLTSS